MICYQIQPGEVETVVSCALCGATSPREVSRVVDGSGTEFLGTAACASCGFVFRDRRPTKAWFSRSFGERERQQAQQGISALNPAIEEERYGRYLQLGRMLAREHSGRSSRPSVLDIGCGPGTGLQAFQDCGFEATGVDEDNTRASHGRSLGLNLWVGPWEDYRPPEQFDLITCLHSIEHFHDPRTLLERMRAWLKPQGQIVIEVPNLRYFVTDWTDSLYLAHMANYTPEGLRRLGALAGLHPDRRLRYYDKSQKNDENLCQLFSLSPTAHRAPESSAVEEPDWEWLTATYRSGLEAGSTLPLRLQVPAINDISLTYKNSGRIAADLRENLHMRSVRFDAITGTYVIF